MPSRPMALARDQSTVAKACDLPSPSPVMVALRQFTAVTVYHMRYISGWVGGIPWYTYPSEKYESQWEGLFPIYYGNSKKCLKPPTSIYIYIYLMCMLLTNGRKKLRIEEIGDGFRASKQHIDV